MPTLAIEIHKHRLRDFCRRWKITKFALFGSAVRPEEFGPDSDVDVLVSFAPEARWTLLHMVAMKDELEEMFGRSVDLLTRRAVEHSHDRFVLVSFAPEAPRDFHSWMTMSEELSRIFGHPVDLLERQGVEGMRNYLRRAAILETAVELDFA